MTALIFSVSGNDLIIVDIFIAFGICAVIIGYFGSKKEIGLLNSFLISLFLTPFVGIIAVVLSDTPVKCNYCKKTYSTKNEFCPNCNKNKDGLAREEVEEELKRSGIPDYFDQQPIVKDMQRETGFYWVKYLGEWTIAQFDITGNWHVPGSHKILDDADFEEIEKESLKRSL
jgi:hypothetical protein